jgi:glycosyltransferase 2 family protein
MKFLKPLLLLAGLGLLAGLVATNQPAEIFASMTRLSWRLGIVLCFPVTLVMIFDTLGWRFAFVRDRVAFTTLVWVRLAGEAFNLTTPTAALGGEAIKAWLLRGLVSLDESVPSIVVAKTTIMIAQGLFLLLGIVLAWHSALADSPLLWAMVGLFAVEVIGLGGFVVAQTRGMFEKGRRLLERFGLRSFGRGHTVRRVDHGLAWFYRHEPARLLLSIAFHFVAWLLGVTEAYLILRFLGIDVSLTTAAVIEAFGTGVRFVTFMIPGSIGALEGSYVATFVALGLSPAAGVSFGLTRRLRELVWVLAGLIAFALLRPERRTLTEITRTSDAD